MRAILAVAGLVAVALSGCSDPAPAVREIEIHIGYTSDREAQYLQPKEIRVKQGETIRLIITNDDKPGASDSFHDVAFRLPGYGALIEHEVSPGETQRGAEKIDTFVVHEKGEYKMWCEVGPLGSQNPDGTPKTRHEQDGMWGTLIVE